MCPVPWTIKYAPKRLAEVYGNDKAKEELKNWLLKGLWREKAAFLYGPPGVGKTSAAICLARDFGFFLIEFSASESRDAEVIRKKILDHIHDSTLFGKRMVLFDDVDIVFSKFDTGALPAIIEVIKSKRVPVVLTAANFYDPKLAPLRKYSHPIEFKRLSMRDIVRNLERICRLERIECDPLALREIAKRAYGDMRSAINDLQFIAAGKKKVTVDDVKALVAYRNRELNIFETLGRFFKADSIPKAMAALTSSMVEFDLLVKWINENVWRALNDPNDIKSVYDVLSWADIYNRRANTTQAWHLMKYMTALTASVPLAAKKGLKSFVRGMTFPLSVKMASVTKEKREYFGNICRKIARRCHLSTKGAMHDIVPYLKIILEANPKYGKKIARSLGLSSDEINFLITGKLPGESIKGG